MAGSGLEVSNIVCRQYVAEGQYIGSHWENEHFEADINQLPANKLGQGQNARPYPQYLGIGVGSGGARTGKYSGVSNYEAVQGLLHKPFGMVCLLNSLTHGRG